MLQDWWQHSARELDEAEFARLRKRMVETQLRRRGISYVRVLGAMSEIPREAFVPQALREEAYEDGPLPIGWGQTISQPFTVAYMVEALQLQGSEKVLEVGTGSGYGAAVLSKLAAVVHTVERIDKLAVSAKERLDRLGYANVHVHVANGSLGLPTEAPFDAIVVTAGAESLPEPYQDQVAEGGRIVIPVGFAASQTLYRFTKHSSRWAREGLGAFAFVPLVGQHGWKRSER